MYIHTHTHTHVYVYVYVCVFVCLPTTPLFIYIYIYIYEHICIFACVRIYLIQGKKCDTRSIFDWRLEFRFSFSQTGCPTKAKEPSLPEYLPLAGGRIIGFMTLPRVLCKMKSTSSMIWTHVAESISHDDNYYTTATSVCVCVCVIIIIKVCRQNRFSWLFFAICL